jgi:hypothetical protein
LSLIWIFADILQFSTGLLVKETGELEKIYDRLIACCLMSSDKYFSEIFVCFCYLDVNNKQTKQKISVSYCYKNPTKCVGLIQSRPHLNLYKVSILPFLYWQKPVITNVFFKHSKGRKNIISLLLNKE